jgi:hypothetical protein
LQPFIPGFHKPLITVNSVPIIAKIVGDLLNLNIKPVVVVSPENAAEIRDTLDFGSPLVRGITFVLQPHPYGPGDALLRGMEACEWSRVMVVCSDNIIEPDVYHACQVSRSRFVITVKVTDDPAQARRYARIEKNFHVDERRYDFTPTGRWEDGKYRLWAGPAVLPRQYMVARLLEDRAELKRHGAELPIASYFNDVRRLYGDPELVEANCVDIGSMDTFEQFFGGSLGH